MTTRRILILLCGAVALVAGCPLVAGCQGEPDHLELADLDPGERQVVERYIVLERARAIALADPEGGVAILDSLSEVWGDSASFEAEVALSTRPARASLLHDLLGRMLEAEQDSLVHAPYPRRLTAPLPEPTPAD